MTSNRRASTASIGKCLHADSGELYATDLEISEIFINFVQIYRKMARQLTRVIGDLRSKIVALAKQRDAALAAGEHCRQETERLRKELDDCRQELKEARMEADFLTISHRIAENPDNLISARRRLQRLIARIDRCVALLREDADIS